MCRRLEWRKEDGSVTRDDFENQIDTFDGLIKLCYEEGCWCCDDVLDCEQMDEEIPDGISYMLEDSSWEEIRDALNSIDHGFDYYVRNGGLEYVPLSKDEDFLRYKKNVERWMDEYSRWDYDSEEEPDADDDIIAEDEDLSVESLMMRHSEYKDMLTEAGGNPAYLQAADGCEDFIRLIS